MTAESQSTEKKNFILKNKESTLNIECFSWVSWLKYKLFNSKKYLKLIQILLYYYTLQLSHYSCSITYITQVIHRTIGSCRLLMLKSTFKQGSANVPQDYQTHRNNIYSLLSPPDFRCWGEKQSAHRYPSPPVLEGLWVINSTLTKSPLARHQAHVVPEQIPF